MMVTPATWIRQNMLDGLNKERPKLHHNKMAKRPLTAAEIKVQQSLEKLSIPDWYLNKSSKAPKLVNDTPIELRPASWKTGSYKKRSSANITLPTSVSMYNGTTTTKRCNGNSLNSTYHSPRVISHKSQKTNADLNNSVSVLLETSADTRLQAALKASLQKLAKKRSNNISKSFPKVSPSRKIQNINLVFAPQPTVKTIEAIVSNESLSDNKSEQNQSLPGKKTQTSGDNDAKKSVEEPEREIFDTTYVKEEHINNETFNIDNEDNELNKSFDCSTTNVLESSKNSSGLLFKSSKLDQSQSFIQNQSILEESYTSRPTPGFNNTFGKYLHLCNITSNIKSQTSLLKTIDEGNENFSPSRPSTPRVSSISTATFTRSKKKSLSPPSSPPPPPPTNVESDEDTINTSENNRSLAEDIIDELRKKCSLRTNPCATRGSTRFVKKLVRVLEKSITKDSEPGLPDQTSAFIRYYDSYDIESGLESTCPPTLSESVYKNSDNDDAYSRGSSSPECNWSMQANAGLASEERKAYYDEEDDVYWIPVPKVIPELPRTSSLLSMSSRSSSRSSSDKTPPNSSPVRTGFRKSVFNYSQNNREFWSSTYKSNRGPLASKRLFKPEAAGVTIARIDSGYSDVSRRSSVVESFLSEWETTQSVASEVNMVSETESNSNYNSLPRNCLAEIHRRYQKQLQIQRAKA